MLWNNNLVNYNILNKFKLNIENIKTNNIFIYSKKFLFDFADFSLFIS